MAVLADKSCAVHADLVGRVEYARHLYDAAMNAVTAAEAHEFVEKSQNLAVTNSLYMSACAALADHQRDHACGAPEV